MTRYQQTRFAAWLAASIIAASLSTTANCASPAEPIALYVDATEAPRRLLHSHLTIPVRAGPLTLVYPRWGIPTYEAPASVIDNIVGLRIAANGRPIEWTRDLTDMFAFHINVPASVDSLSVALDVVAPQQRSDLNAATGQLLVVDWQTLVLYPEGAAVADLPTKARLRLPAAWKQASALVSARTGDSSLSAIKLVTTVWSTVSQPIFARGSEHLSTTIID